MDFAPDGSRLALALGHAAGIVEPGSGALHGLPVNRYTEPRLVRFSRDGATLLVATIDKRVHVLDGADARPLALFEPGGMVTGAAFLPDNQRVLLGLWDGSLGIWDIAGQRLGGTQGHIYGEVQVAVSADGTRAVSAADDQTVRLWELPALRQVRLFVDERYGIKAAQSMMRGVAFGAGDATVLASAWLLYCGTLRPTLLQFDAAGGQILQRLPGALGCGAESLVVAARGRRAAFVNRDLPNRPAAYFDLETWRMLGTFGAAEDRRTSAVALSPDGLLLVSAAVPVNGAALPPIRFWDAPAGALIATVTPEVGRPWTVAFADGRREELGGRTPAPLFAAALAQLRARVPAQ